MNILHLEHRYKPMIRQKIFNGIKCTFRFGQLTCAMNLGDCRYDFCHNY